MTTQDFPYIKTIHVNDCYTYKNFDIVISENDEWRHLILTGKNGSGKTTILNGIAAQINLLANKDIRNQFNSFKNALKVDPTSPSADAWKKMVHDFEYNVSEIKLTNQISQDSLNNKNSFVFSHFKAYRKVQLSDVSSVTKETEFVDKLQKTNSEGFTQQFKQYLVNKKVYQAFDVIENNKESLNRIEEFFRTFTSILQNIFNDKNLELKFVREQFEFFIVLSDGREITFNVLSEGFSALLSVIMDILMRVDLIRKLKNDYTFDPPGIVLIDEPETHLHLEMQYQVLPLLTKLFPNIQFIAATHSPAVISSITNATVYDLSTQMTKKDEVAGSSFSELMVTHFGLDNEFSPVADKLIADVNQVLNEARTSKNPNEAREKLQHILTENKEVLTPSLKLEIEAAILQLEQ